MKSLYHNQKQLTSERNIILSRRTRKGDLKARKEMIEGNAGFAYKRAIRYATMNSGWSHIEDDDILQAALLGLVEAVDRYDPDTGYSFTTYAHFWILKRITEEISTRIWTSMRPPRKDMRAFLYRKMDSSSTGDFIHKYMNGAGDTLSDSREQNPYNWVEVINAVERARLTPDEQRVFESLYGENEGEDNLTDLSREELGDIEFNMLQKIKKQL